MPVQDLQFQLRDLPPLPPIAANLVSNCVTEATEPEFERCSAAMGFSFMEAFMDRIEVRSKKGEGTRVVMWKYIEREREQ